MLSEGPSSSSGGRAIQSWNPRVRPGSPSPPPCQTPPPARIHSIPPAGQQARRSVRVFITDASLCDIGNGRDAGMWVEPEPGERSTLIIDEVKEHEGFQEPSKVGWRHQACDRSVFLSAGPFGDSRTGIALNKSCWRHNFAFLNVSLKTGALPSALFVYHSKS